MCREGEFVRVHVRVPADLDTSGREAWKDVQVDSCIATLVDALQSGGIDMRGSCCGHGAKEGHVHLQDGRTLLVLNREQAEIYFGKMVPIFRGRESDAVQRQLPVSRLPLHSLQNSPLAGFDGDVS